MPAHTIAAVGRRFRPCVLKPTNFKPFCSIFKGRLDTFIVLKTKSHQKRLFCLWRLFTIFRPSTRVKKLPVGYFFA